MAVPANTITSPEGLDPASPGSLFDLLPLNGADQFDQVQTSGALIAPLLEQDRLLAISRTRLQIIDYPYGVAEPVDELEAISRSKGSAVLATLMVLAAGGCSVTGQSASSRYTRAIKADAGGFAATGQNAGSLRGYRWTGLEAGVLTSTGQGTALRYQRLPLAGEVGAVALTGKDATFFKGANLVAAGGNLTTTGQDSRGLRGYLVAASAGSFTVTGQDAQLSLEDFFGKWATQTYGYEALVYPEMWAD
jgi:hypothetical protein